MLQFAFRRDKPVSIILGIIFFLAGVYTVLQPKMTMLAITYLFAGLFIFRGLISVAGHFIHRLRRKRREKKQQQAVAAQTQLTVPTVPDTQNGNLNAEPQAPSDAVGAGTFEYSALVFGILLILMGGLFLLRLDFTTVLVTYFLGFYFLTDAIFAFIYGVRKKSRLGLLFLFVSLVLFACALLLLFGTEQAILPAYLIIGISLIADGINTAFAPYAR